MREILFRGKRVDNGEWVEGYYTPCSYGKFPFESAIVIKEGIDTGYWAPEKIIPETVGQYTGLTDKNGKKIFEGDICEVTLFDPFDHDTQYYCSVIFYTEIAAFVFVCGDLTIPFGEVADFESDVEVIGNIFDNPELLEGDEKE